MILALAVPAFTNQRTTADEIKRPNLLFIFADDQCFDTIHALGNDEVHTPNLDRLVRQGTTFTTAYNMGSWTGAVCVASRTMLNTGKFVWRARNQDLRATISNQSTWSQLLRNAGYETYMSGKWHVNGLDTSEIFDHVAHQRPGMPNQTQAGYQRPKPNELDPWSPSDPKFGGFWKGGQHWSEVLGDDAISFIDQASASDQPFFMYLAFNAPHDPRQSPQRFVDMYPPQQIRIPASFQPEYPFKKEIGCYVKPGRTPGEWTTNLQRDESLAPWPRTEFAVRVHRQEYYAIISHMDEQIGRILDALQASGKMDNTYIFFTADHGLACGNHGLMGKQNMYEHSMRPPLILAGRNVPAGESRDVPVYLQDIMPTTLELAGVTKPDYVEFHSLLPYVQDASAGSAYDAIYGCYQTDLQRMVRVGDWKLIVYPRARVVRLYDLKNDPQELSDLADDPKQQNRIKRLMRRLIRLQHEMDDTLDVATLFPKLTQ